jgi:chromosome segregation ATPase
MDPIIMAAISAGSSLLAMGGGVLIGRGDKATQIRKLQNAKRSIDILSVDRPVSENSEKSDDTKFDNNDTEVITDSDRLEAEIELLQSEIKNKDNEIENLSEKNSRLGGRILALEGDLQKGQATTEDVIKSVKKQENSESIKDGMDTFMSALQAESDTLREELENAYQMINRQEREISRLKGSENYKESDALELHSKIDLLNEEIDDLREEIIKYQHVIRDSASNSKNMDAILAVNISMGQKLNETTDSEKENSHGPSDILATEKQNIKESSKINKKAQALRNLLENHGANSESATIESKILASNTPETRMKRRSISRPISVKNSPITDTSSKKLKTLIPKKGAMPLDTEPFKKK